MLKFNLLIEVALAGLIWSEGFWDKTLEPKLAGQFLRDGEG